MAKPEAGARKTTGQTTPHFIVTAALAVLVFGLLAFAFQPRDLHSSDFFSFWAGARLAGGGMYDARQVEALQQSVSPLVTSKPYIRPPFYAVLLWPLGQLPFRAAYLVWFLINLGAVIAFVWAWRFRPESYIACALFIPLGYSFGMGQDAPLLLLSFAAGARLIERRNDLLGGAVLALCAIKPHLALLLPVVLLAQRRYRALVGMAAAGGVLYLLSAAALGMEWPVAFVRAALENESGIHPRLLGLSGFTEGLHGVRWVLPVLAIAGAALVYVRARAAAWLPAISFALAAGLVFGPRALPYDASLFLPLLLLYFPPLAVAAFGAALALVLTPAAIVAQIAGIAILAVAGRRREIGG